MVKHIVLVRFKKETSQAAIRAIFEKIRALESVLPTMQSFDYGLYNGAEARYKGFDYAFYMTFNNAQERDEYLVHPEHVKVGAELRSMLDPEGSESFFAFDYDTDLL
ncbi:Dabb family protein [Wohlfahrtiimonas chitiniclastica]|uniref:Dabb family protein n=1 Tax=Wohlfahrtiimonas chitiniclastica TaxID=400946 RepID=A0AB35BZ54_9GAMM|nr:Dabb family protein [Wohlfahrtiimonas chitiniclastica]MBS7824557.1 Dabb family protein [Wohlfahrtiimonas chitiniclastica]MBS7828482.1 Dabb family protein [Wohlfahrtiimonas chitiniclastica]MBS7840020.1 Dabb family protein [Wohlfahrtiimonas chitiniclastica]